MRKIIIPFFALLFILAIPDVGTTIDKPEPPPGLLKIFGKFTELEGSLEAKRWDEAIMIAGEVDRSFTLLLKDIRWHVSYLTIDEYNRIMDDLKGSLKKGDLALSHEYYIQLQRLFFEIMRWYDYKIPPPLIIITKYLIESSESVRKNDFKNVKREMQEILEIFEIVEPQVGKAGGSLFDLQMFNSLCKRTISAAGDKDREQVASFIDELNALTTKMINLFRIE